MSEDAMGPYATYVTEDFPGATLVLYVPVIGAAIGLGAFVDSPGGYERVKQTHHDWTRDLAARQVADGMPRDFLDRVGTPHRHFAPHGTSEAGRERHASVATADRIASALRLRDAYKASRQIEESFRVEADDGLYRSVSEALGRVASREASQECRDEAAREMQASSPGRATLLNRMMAKRRSDPMPEDVAYDPNDGGTTVRKVLGSLIVTPSGEGWFSGDPRPVELTVVAGYDVGSMEFEDGEVVFAGIDFHLLYDPATWSVARDGQLYGDEAVSAAVNELLERRGFGDVKASWSESARQGGRHADMDVGYGIIERLWPERFAEERQAALASPRP